MTTELPAAQAAFSQMAAALAHEIKNPAAVAMAHVNLLRLDTEQAQAGAARLMPAALGVHLNHIEQALMDISDLVQEMLFAVYNRVEPYNIDFHEMLAEMLDTYRAAWPGISFSLSTNVPLECLGQESSLRMIFSNLLKNAVEAVESVDSPDYAGQISIHASHCGGFLNINICDNGKYATSHKPYGNGLGLAICRHLARQMGGSLEIHDGESGCIATVSLPQ